MRIRHVALFALAVSLVLFGAAGCGGAADTGDEPAVEPSVTEPEPAVEPAGEAPEDESPAVPADYDEFLAEAAAQANFTFYAPSEIPPDFTFLPGESSIGPDGVSTMFASGDARLWVQQGSFDVGEGPVEVSGVSATFGPLDATLYSDVGFARDSADELYGTPGEAVLAADGPTTYMVFGVGVSRVYLLSTARDMVLFE
jgi:hypothetical protein